MPAADKTLQVNTIKYPEDIRLDEDRLKKCHWRRWGPYLSERQWGTVREDYSPEGNAWHSFPHHHATMRAYRWGEDGLGGISDNHQRLCLAFAFWNGADSILKERLFGLTWTEGNHGEAVKEYYHYVDSLPSHAYMHYFYRYPQREFPYEQLLEGNRARSRKEVEYDLIDTGVFAGAKYFDIDIRYAKRSPTDIVVCLSVRNCGAGAAQLCLLPTLWFRNLWSWGGDPKKPVITVAGASTGTKSALARDTNGAEYSFNCFDADELLFTENETNFSLLYGGKNVSDFTKDAFHRYLIKGEKKAVNPGGTGTKCASLYRLELAGGEEKQIFLQLRSSKDGDTTVSQIEELLTERKGEADQFYERFIAGKTDPDLVRAQRQAFAGLLWTKQYYHYVVRDWIEGDDPKNPPPPSRKAGRNHAWGHLYSEDILSMPDKWEYPWFASWDTAFHLIPFARIDPEFAKKQLLLLTREWYMHPNGQIPAYEWDFNDVTPPVQAWAAIRIYKIERKNREGTGDLKFLERVFQKLLLNFTWWVNRKDPGGNNIFEGGFLGLDNIGVFDRSKELPTGGRIKQSDSTSWMAFYCLNMLEISLELARHNDSYEDIASKFFEHFLFISYAMNHRGESMPSLWNTDDGFYYDVLQLPNGEVKDLKVRSLVGLIPLFASLTLEPELLDKLPNFKRRMEWFVKNRPDLHAEIAQMDKPGVGNRILLALVNEERMRSILRKMFDEQEFLSPFGIRSVSKFHETHPFIIKVGEADYRVDYEPGESISNIYGGNSNWRGPIWWPINFLLIESLQRFGYYFGDSFKLDLPVGSGRNGTLDDAAKDLSSRLLSLFMRAPDGALNFNRDRTPKDAPDFFKDHVFFYEYFHGDTGRGLGASHQTGWTALVAKLIEQSRGSL